jgi:hypothetical protein
MSLGRFGDFASRVRRFLSDGHSSLNQHSPVGFHNPLLFDSSPRGPTMLRMEGSMPMKYCGIWIYLSLSIIQTGCATQKAPPTPVVHGPNWVPASQDPSVLALMDKERLKAEKQKEISQKAQEKLERDTMALAIETARITHRSIEEVLADWNTPKAPLPDIGVRSNRNRSTQTMVRGPGGRIICATCSQPTTIVASQDHRYYGTGGASGSLCVQSPTGWICRY